MAVALSPAPVASTMEVTSVWRLSVDQYHAMISAGIIAEDDPVELLDGILVQKMAKDPPHRITTRTIRQALESRVPTGWYVDTQEPIVLPTSEPEPDAMVARGDSTDYLDRNPDAANVALVVEIADSTLNRDRYLKRQLYARAGIPIYWLVDLTQRQFEVYTEPKGDTYLQVHIFTMIDSVPLVIDGKEYSQIPVKSLLLY